VSTPRRPNRSGRWPMVVTLAIGATTEAALALAVNAASAKDRWPGPLDYVRRYPWPSAVILVAVILAILLWERRKSTSGEDATDAAAGGRTPNNNFGNIGHSTESRTTHGTFYEIRGGVVNIQGSDTHVPTPQDDDGSPLRTELETSNAQPRLVRVGDVPMAASSFQTRPDLAAQIESAVAGRIATLVTLPGQRGAGKTQLAAAVARRRLAERWTVVAWINAETQAGLHAGLEDLADELGIRHEDDTAVQAGRRVRQYFEMDGDECLLVFDNAEEVGELRQFLPRSGQAQIIVTTTRRSFTRLGGATVVNVGGFTSPEAIAYLRSRTGLDDPAGAATLADELGYLPLGLAQASWVIASQGLTYKSYLDKLHSQPISQVFLRDSADEYRLSVVQAISLGLDDLDRRNETGARRLLELICLLSADGVPRRYFRDIPKAGFNKPRSQKNAASVQDNQSAAREVEFPALAQHADVDAALGSLAEASLLLFSEDRSRVAVHRLVAMVVRFLSREWHFELANRARSLLNQPDRKGELGERAWRRWIDPVAMLPDNMMKSQWIALVDSLRSGGAQVQWSKINDLVSQYKALVDNVYDPSWKWRGETAARVNEFGLDAAIDKAKSRVTELEGSSGRHTLPTAYARVQLAYAYWAGRQIDGAVTELVRAHVVFRHIHGPSHAHTQMVAESLKIARSEIQSTAPLWRMGRIREIPERISMRVSLWRIPSDRGRKIGMDEEFW
jgi:hypothetical protein